MKRLGELLKQARLARNLTLEEISERTKIQRRYLEALERGDSSPFAGEVYFKGALRNFAETVGLDPREVLDRYHRFKEEAGQPGDGAGEREQAVDAGKTAKRTWRARPAKRTPPVESKPAPPPDPRKGPSFKAGVILLSLVLLGGIIYGIYTGFTGKPPAQTPPANTVQPGDREQPPDDPVIEPGPEPENTVTRTGTADGETTYTVSGSAEVEVTIHLYGRCWMQILADGRQTHQGTYEYGQEIAVTGARSVWMRLGYPPVARITVNGTEITGLKERTLPHNFNFILK